MASFYAELEVAGHTYPLRTGRFKFTQGTDNRGRANEKVRHGPVHLTLDVPEDCFLEHWAATAHMPLAGHITFYETDQRTARETLSWEVGHCVGYDEGFVSGDWLDGPTSARLPSPRRSSRSPPAAPTGPS